MNLCLTKREAFLNLEPAARSPKHVDVHRADAALDLRKSDLSIMRRLNPKSNQEVKTHFKG